MATYNTTTKTFTLEVNELNFAIPATLEGAPTPADTKIVGNGLANILTGDATNNVIEGGLGNDILIGGAGDDLLDGGAGFDIASYADASAGVSIDLAGSSQLPLAPVAVSDVFVSIEGVIGSGFEDILRGDNYANLLNGGDGIDEIYGNGGNDTIIGGAGADKLWGGEGIDTLSYAGSNLGVNVSLADGSEAGRATSTGDAQGDVYYEFENIIGSSNADSLNGNNSDNRIEGGFGNDTLTAKLGNDTLDGGVGVDDMQGEQGNDLYYVDNAADNVRERDGNGYDTVITSVSYVLPFQEVEVLQAAAGFAAINLTANSYANTVIGNDGANVIDGKAGADAMYGRGGNDTYHVDNVGDAVIEDSAWGGLDHVHTSISYALTAHVENLTAIGSNAISLTGNELNNTIVGNGANNVIVGGGGADVMIGGGGNDTYYVDNIGDVIIDNSGVDTVIITNPSVLAAMSASLDNITAVAGTAAINLNGNTGANILTGNSGANKLSGGKGKDTLTGGKGKDIFIFNTKPSKKDVDKITDFKVKDDSIWLDNKYFKKLGKKGTEKKPAKLNKKFFSLDKAKDKDDYLIYNKKKGILSYDADGSGSKKAIEIAKLDKKLKMTYKDFFVI